MKQEFKRNGGVKSICNYGGYEIQISEDMNYCRFRLFGKEITRWRKIRYTRKYNEPFAILNGKREYFKDYMTI